MTGWRGRRGPYTSIYTLAGDRGGGLEYSRLGRGVTDSVYPGAGFRGGGNVASTAAPLAGFGGCGGPGPGALIGVNGG